MTYRFSCGFWAPCRNPVIYSYFPKQWLDGISFDCWALAQGKLPTIKWLCWQRWREKHAGFPFRFSFIGCVMKIIFTARYASSQASSFSSSSLLSKKQKKVSWWNYVFKNGSSFFPPTKAACSVQMPAFVRMCLHFLYAHAFNPGGLTVLFSNIMFIQKWLTTHRIWATFYFVAQHLRIQCQRLYWSFWPTYSVLSVCVHSFGGQRHSGRVPWVMWLLREGLYHCTKFYRGKIVRMWLSVLLFCFPTIGGHVSRQWS